ncbi:hypothetical protein RAZWK3B_10772 [Roseobacter sp. AzwK-3b]|nr:hypothetical protein RAZWK3B_10772 [Roseobacter sp. AzwK-3b]
MFVVPFGTPLGKAIHHNMSDLLGPWGEALPMVIKVERLGFPCKGLARLDQNETINHAVKFPQAQFQKIQLVKKREAIIKLGCMHKA